MTDEKQDPRDPRAEAAADLALTLFALGDDVARGAYIGATIACQAALQHTTPLQLLDALKAEMPDDETWERDLAERTRRKCRNATRWYRGAKIEYVAKGNQG